jgi:hypothetical protein
LEEFYDEDIEVDEDSTDNWYSLWCKKR